MPAAPLMTITSKGCFFQLFQIRVQKIGKSKLKIKNLNQKCDGYLSHRMN